MSVPSPSGNRIIDGLSLTALLIPVMALLGQSTGRTHWASWGEGRPVLALMAAAGLILLSLLLVATERWLALPIRVSVRAAQDEERVELAIAKVALQRGPKYLIRLLSLAGLLIACAVWFWQPSWRLSSAVASSWLPAPHTLWCLCLLFVASFASTYQQVRSLIIVQMAAFAVVLISLSALVGQLFGTRSPMWMGFTGYAGSVVGMSLPASVALMALGCGYLVYAGRDFFLAVPVRLFSGFGAVVLLLLSMAGLPLLLGWMIAAWGLGEQYGQDSALALLVVANVFLQLPVILHVARRLFFQEYRLRGVVRQLEEAVAHKAELAERLRDLSLRDALTGLANRRAFDEALRRAWRRGRRTGHPVSLLYLDIDFFKAYNDFYGHPAGDACLVEVARLLERVANRESDLAARLGGEEFVVLLSETDAAGAGCVAERFHRLLAERALPHQGSAVADCLTVSIGIASCQPDGDSEADRIIDQADQALYAAKHAGRNRTFVAPAR